MDEIEEETSGKKDPPCHEVSTDASRMGSI